MAFDEIRARFDALAEIYRREYEAIDLQAPYQTAYTNYDFFSLDIFCCEFNNIAKDKVQLYLTPEELEGSKNIFIVMIQNSKPLCIREYYGEKVFYDSVFVHSDTESWRYHIYKNEDELKPIFVEHLERSQSGSPVLYEKYSAYGYETRRYNWLEAEDHPCKIEVSHFSTEGEPAGSSLYTAFYENDQVDTILDQRGRTFYRAKNFETSIEEIIQEVKTLIISAIARTMEEKHQKFSGRIAFALFEYCLQGAFPPTIALATKEEAENNGEDPLLAYNAPDLKYFSEEDGYEFDFYHQGANLYEVLNTYLTEDLEDDDAIALAREIYSDICTNSEVSGLFKRYLDAEDDFHMAFYDIDACDLDETIRLTVPEATVNRLYAKQKEFIDNRVIPPEYAEEHAKRKANLEVDPQRWEEMVSAAREAAKHVACLSEQLHYLKPLEYEVKHTKRSAPPVNPEHYARAPKEPSEEAPYKHYWDEFGNISLIEVFHSGGLGKQVVFLYGETMCRELVKYVGADSLESHGILYRKQQQPLRYIDYNFHDVRTDEYKIEDGNIIETKQSVLAVEEETNWYAYSQSYRRFAYSKSGELTTVRLFLSDGEMIGEYDLEE